MISEKMKLEALPKGFRFRPTDQELINHYLRLKINGSHSTVQVIPEIDVCKWEPWDLPALSVIKSDDPEWFFFCPRDRKYPNGHRSNRATEAGYWKATGKDRTIKCHKSSHSGGSNTSIIGMKKTLVFYKGRAPKGERTNWIMHEYRPTEPDLDGTAPGQGDYVLCRLFHKVDETLENSKYDEVDPTGSSPSISKSSPDDMSSELLQKPLLLDTVAINAPEDINKWSTYETDQTTAFVMPVERCDSGAVDHSQEEMVRQIYAPVKEDPVSEGLANSQFDDYALHTSQLRDYSDLGDCVGSPFANDFGNDHNGSLFQDGTSEQDVSFSSFLKDLENSSSLTEYSVGHNNSVVANDMLMHSVVNELGKTPEMVQAQIQHPVPKCHGNIINLLQGQESPLFSRSNDVNEGASPLNMDSMSSQFYMLDKSFYSEIPGEDMNFTTPMSGTRIKIQSRQPRSQPSDVNSTTQGTTFRRIRLNISHVKELRLQSLNTGAIEDTDTSRKSQKAGSTVLSEDNVEETASSPDPGLGLPMKKDGKYSCAKIALLMSSTASSARRGASFLRVYAVSMYLVIILSVVFLGVWKYPSLHILQG